MAAATCGAGEGDQVEQIDVNDSRDLDTESRPKCENTVLCQYPARRTNFMASPLRWDPTIQVSCTSLLMLLK